MAGLETLPGPPEDHRRSNGMFASSRKRANANTKVPAARAAKIALPILPLELKIQTIRIVAGKVTVCSLHKPGAGATPMNRHKPTA
jgi:hypothetical protein